MPAPPKELTVNKVIDRVSQVIATAQYRVRFENAGSDVLEMAFHLLEPPVELRILFFWFGPDLVRCELGYQKFKNLIFGCFIEN